MSHAVRKFKRRIILRNGLFKRCRLLVAKSDLILHLIFFTISFAVAIFQELGSFALSPKNWHRLSPHEDDSRFIRILIVADPQLLGDNDAVYPFYRLTQFDADRYLAKYFTRAFTFVHPHMVLFLGDLFDEGAIANDWEYAQYVSRFKDIFPVSKDVLQLYIPGDNDIGINGEDNEPFYSRLHLSFFEKAFGNVTYFKNVGFYYLRFVKANVIAGRYKYVNKIDQNETGSFTVVISHPPLLTAFSSNARQILHNVRPHLILSGHEHKASYAHSQIINSRRRRRTTFDRIKSKDPPLSFTLSNDSIFEITSPTCSYRMGASSMGYGNLLIEQLWNGQVSVQYTVLWTPGRYVQLYIYLFLIFIYLFVTILKALRPYLSSV